MIAENIDPSCFTISKGAPQFPDRYVIGGGVPAYFDYIVHVKGKSFTVTKSNDLQFLEYFYNLCFPLEEKEWAHEHPVEQKLGALISRLVKWLKDKPDFL